MLLTSEQQQIDSAVNSVLGWIADKWSRERNITLTESYKTLLSDQLYEDLLDYSNYLYKTDPLELYRMFEANQQGNESPSRQRVDL
jgi:hypothetical protein